jgi:hypothetical protein
MQPMRLAEIPPATFHKTMEGAEPRNHSAACFVATCAISALRTACGAVAALPRCRRACGATPDQIARIICLARLRDKARAQT